MAAVNGAVEGAAAEELAAAVSEGPHGRHSDLTWPLSVAVNAGRLTVWLGAGQPSVGLQTDDVVVAVDADGDLLAVSVPWPRQAAELWPEAGS